MSKTGSETPTRSSAMFFQPIARVRRAQLPISERRLLLMLGDVFAIGLSFLIGLRVWALVAPWDYSLDFIVSQLYLFVVLVVLWLLLASASDLYQLRVAASRGKTVQRLLAVNAQMLVVYVAVFFFSPREALPRLFILYYAVASVVLIGLWRMTRPFLLGWASDPRRTLVVGGGRSAPLIVSAINEHARDAYEVRGIIGANDEIGQVVEGVPVVGTGSDLMNFVVRDRITELIITSTRALDAETFSAIMDAYERGIQLVPLALLYEEITGRVPVEHISDDWAMILLPIASSGSFYRLNQFAKRALDVLLGTVGLVVFLVLLPLLALWIKLDSRGSVFYTQERVGLNGRVFRIYKLRSMVSNAEAQTGAVFSHRGDPRVTRFGRIARRTRLDELPQLWNVLRGDMSLIGPRPERPEHVARLTEKIPFYRTRLIVRPGLSGWAQVQYEYGANDEDALIKLQYDLYYIRHQSLALDLNILIRTVFKALLFKGV